MPRLCKPNFLQSYLELTDKMESPELFHLWGAISIIGASLGRKCWVERGFYRTYPNQYILFISESARCRKTTASDIAVKLYKESKVGEVIKGKITMRALSKRLHQNRAETGTSSAFVYSPDLGKLFGADSYTSGLMMFFTDFWDSPSEDAYETATQGKDIFKDVFLHLLGCTVYRWLETMPGDMVEGGFSSRTIFVVQNIPRSANPTPSLSPKEIELRKKLIHDLQEIAKIAGPFRLTDKAGVYYDTWYVREYNDIDNKDIRLRPYFGRKGEHVLKLAMALNAARSDKREIDHLDITASLELLKQVEKNMPSAFAGVSFSQSTKYIDRIMMQIEENGGKISHSALLKKNHYYMDRDELRKILDTLRESNMIRMEAKPGGRRVYYVI